LQEHRHGGGVDAALEGDGVVGFHTLVVGVDHQGQGLGAALLFAWLKDLQDMTGK
jgi:predicted N-acetyltransferase YhbS